MQAARIVGPLAVFLSIDPGAVSAQVRAVEPKGTPTIPQGAHLATCREPLKPSCGGASAVCQNGSWTCLAMEYCNGKDDDRDGQTDENALCRTDGPTCAVASCEQTWKIFPPERPNEPPPPPQRQYQCVDHYQDAKCDDSVPCTVDRCGEAGCTHTENHAACDDGIATTFDECTLEGCTHGLKGYADLHTHPMSYLGFGQKAVHGVPDVGLNVPSGTHDCNGAAFPAKNMGEALGNCNATHGGFGFALPGVSTANTCGDSLRAAILTHGVDDKYVYNLPPERNVHGDHPHEGYPTFPTWPHQSSKLHQQMWWEWLKRAKDGGLRVMVALAVNNETLAALLNGNAPYDDASVAELQIEQTIAFVNGHLDFMEIARSPADVRRIVADNRLAVILGMEVDRIGNFGKSGVKTNAQAIRVELRRLFAKGVRYVFPVHLIDNAFGGAAVYNLLFNFANNLQNGRYYRVNSDPTIGYSTTLTSGPRGLENGLVMALAPFLEGLKHLPAPCINDISCFPGQLRCCGSTQFILNTIKPSPAFDAYKAVAPGHVNCLGLTSLGEVAINEMMKLGMLIDIDHMSQRAAERTLEIASAVPGGYPLIMGHNGLRGDGGNERAAPRHVLTKILTSGGMLGLGTSDTTPAALTANHRVVLGLSGPNPSDPTKLKSPARGSVGLGTDVDGFEPLPRNGRTGTEAELARASTEFYRGFAAHVLGSDFIEVSTKQEKPAGGQYWDYITGGGVAHYGLMPEFMYDVRLRDPAAYESLMRSADYFLGMWQTIQQRARRVGNPPPSTIATTCAMP